MLRMTDKVLQKQAMAARTNMTLLMKAFVFREQEVVSL